MLRSEAITLIKGRLARFNDQVIEPYIIAELKATQAKLELDAVLPWFLITEEATVSQDIDEDRILIPTGFLREIDENAFYYVDSAGDKHPLQKMDYDDMVQRYGASGDPMAYALHGKYFRVRPVPSSGASYSVAMNFYKADTILSTDVENNWLKYYPELMICETVRVMAANYTKDLKTATTAAEDFRAARGLMLTNEQARKDANRMYWSED